MLHFRSHSHRVSNIHCTGHNLISLSLSLPCREDIVGPYEVGKPSTFRTAPSGGPVKRAMLPPGKDPDPVGTAARHVVALGFVAFAYAVAAALSVRIGEGGGEA